MLTSLGIALMRLVGRLPLRWVRALGGLLGYLLFALAVSRRHVVQTNLKLCFPVLTEKARRKLVRQTFVRFAQAWLDRGWLWHGDQALLSRRLRLRGDLNLLQGDEPLVLFAPHFVGLDAGWTALNLHLAKPLVTIYAHQSNARIDQWILAGRKRVGTVQLFDRADGVKPILQSMRSGAALYLLPDMSFGAKDSFFVPFYGIPAATVPSLSRFARAARANVLPVLTRMTPQGYETEVLGPWEDFPGPDLDTDTTMMNARLQTYIDAMPEQYFWVHRRFKDRPPGLPPVY